MPHKVLHVSDETYDNIVSRFDRVIVDFFTDWCGPCKVMSPIVEDIAKEYAGKVVFVKINAQHNPKSASKMGITSVPTFVGYRNGKPILKAVGAIRRKGLEKMIEVLNKDGGDK